MEERPYILVGGLILLLAIGAAVAWFVGSDAAERSASDSIATKTYRAKSGTQRKDAKAIVNQNRSHDASKPGTSASKVEIWGRFEGEGESRPDNPREDAELLAEEVGQDLSPEEGIAVLEAELAVSEAPAHLYAALIEQYAKLDPPDMQRSEGAFALAMSNATVASEREAAIEHFMSAWAAQGNWDRVRELAGQHVTTTGEPTLRGFEIEILHAESLRQIGNPDEAAKILEGLLGSQSVDDRLVEEEFRSAYRLAALRLSRIYREQGNASGAERVARESGARLRR